MSAAVLGQLYELPEHDQLGAHGEEDPEAEGGRREVIEFSVRCTFDLYPQCMREQIIIKAHKCNI